MTVWRKLPTMMPTAVIIAMAVESAPTRTEVRRKEAARLREASMASTRKKSLAEKPRGKGYDVITTLASPALTRLRAKSQLDSQKALASTAERRKLRLPPNRAREQARNHAIC